MSEKKKTPQKLNRVIVADTDKICLKKAAYGLPYDVYLMSANAKILRELPIIEVAVNDQHLFVSISRDNPVSEKDFPRETEIFDWVLDNYRTLTRHYHQELTDQEVLQMLLLPPDIED